MSDDEMDHEMEVDSEVEEGSSSESENQQTSYRYQYRPRSPTSYYGYNGAADSDDDGNMIDAVDMGYGEQGDSEPAPGPEEEEDLGYEPCGPGARRNSMTHQQERERRASIKAVMTDTTLSPMTKRRSIQHLMDGRRKSMSNMAGGPLFNGGSTNVRGGVLPSLPLGGRRNSMSGAYVGSGFSANMNNAGRRLSCSGGSNSTVASTYAETSTTTSIYNYEPNNSSQANVDVDAFNYGYEDQNEQQHHSQTCIPVNSNYAYTNEQTRMAERQRPACTHYERNCTIIAACCGAVFGCRLCHDDAPSLPPKIMSAPGGRKVHRSASLPSSYVSMDPDDTHHNIDRFAIAEVICRICFTRQSSKTNACVRCNTQFGDYHCNICNLWMQNDERPYHCKDCGFCRVGGAENFLHCHSCGMCIDKNLIDTHNCRAGKYRSNCPVCQEYLFSSRGASHEMPCGHAIHWECFRQMAAHDSRCPICKKTAETPERMMPIWDTMAASIALQPIPPELARVVSMSCNDCEKNEDARAWHFLGIQCTHCKSFNTVVDKILLTGEDAHEFLETNARMAAIHQQRQQQEANVAAIHQQRLQQEANVAAIHQQGLQQEANVAAIHQQRPQQEANGSNSDLNHDDNDDPDRPRQRRFNRRRSAF